VQHGTIPRSARRARLGLDGALVSEADRHKMVVGVKRAGADRRWLLAAWSCMRAHDAGAQQLARCRLGAACKRKCQGCGERRPVLAGEARRGERRGRPKAATAPAVVNDMACMRASARRRVELMLMAHGGRWTCNILCAVRATARICTRARRTLERLDRRATAACAGVAWGVAGGGARWASVRFRNLRNMTPLNSTGM
jgi:hypothetical protein